MSRSATLPVSKAQQLSPTEARHKAAIHKRIEALDTIRQCACADGTGESYDAEACGEAMASLGMPEAEFQLGAQVIRDDSELKDFERSYDAKLASAKKILADGAKSSISVPAIWLAEVKRRLQNPMGAYSHILEFPAGATKPLGK